MWWSYSSCSSCCAKLHLQAHSGVPISTCWKYRFCKQVQQDRRSPGHLRTLASVQIQGLGNRQLFAAWEYGNHSSRCKDGWKSRDHKTKGIRTFQTAMTTWWGNLTNRMDHHLTNHLSIWRCIRLKHRDEYQTPSEAQWQLQLYDTSKCRHCLTTRQNPSQKSQRDSIWEARALDDTRFKEVDLLNGILLSRLDEFSKVDLTLPD